MSYESLRLQRQRTKQRVARHRMKRISEAEAAAEAKAEREELIAQYGTDRVEDVEWTNTTVNIAMHLKEFFAGKPSKVTKDNVLECLDSLERWQKFYEKDPYLDDSWLRCCRMGLLPKPQDATSYFQRRYREYAGMEVPKEPSQLTLEMKPAEPPKPVPKVEEPPKPVIITKEAKPPKILSMDEYLDQQHGFTSSRVGE